MAEKITNEKAHRYPSSGRTLTIGVVTDRQALDSLDVPRWTDALVQIEVRDADGTSIEIDWPLSKFREMLRRAGI